MNSANGFREQGRHGQGRQFRVRLNRRGPGHRIRCHHLPHFVECAEALEGIAREEAVGAGDGDMVDLLIPEPADQFDNRAASGDLVVQDDHTFSVDVADDRVNDDLPIADPAFAARGHR